MIHKPNKNILGYEALYKLVTECKFKSIIDIGCGAGNHTNYLRQNGKVVTPVDFYGNVLNMKTGLYQDIKLQKHDAVWCCHVLEHVLDVNSFLKKIHKDLKEGGYLCITVPPLKHEIVGGHVTLWNAGLLMYNLVLAGFNCKNIKIKKYGYNISIIIKKETYELPKHMNYDKGDLELLEDAFPTFVHQGFNGDIENYNW